MTNIKTRTIPSLFHFLPPRMAQILLPRRTLADYADRDFRYRAAGHRYAA